MTNGLRRLPPRSWHEIRYDSHRWPPSSLVTVPRHSGPHTGPHHTSVFPTRSRAARQQYVSLFLSRLSSVSLELVVVRRSCTARTGLLRPCGYSHCTPTCTRPAPCTTAWPGFSRVGSAHDGPRPHTGWAIPTLHFRRICCAHSACASLTKKVACGCSPASSSEMPVLASVPTKRG